MFGSQSIEVGRNVSGLGKKRKSVLYSCEESDKLPELFYSLLLKT
jgi:hypothetical protein